MIDLRPILTAVGILLIILSLFMLPPLVADLVSGNPDWRAFVVAGAVTLFAGVSLVLTNRAPATGELSARQAFVLTTSAWLFVTVFASLPLVFSTLEDLTLADCFFEAMSGITTTGATVIFGLDTAPPGILLWRAILQWLGGIGIIVMGIAILPMLRVGGMQLFRTESTDLSEKILPRAAQIASAIGLIYLAFTLVCAVLYWLAGMTPFDAAAHALTTVATGGYSTSDASIAVFQSAAVEWIAVVFMILGAIPFVLYIQVVNGAPGAFLRDSQVRWFLGILAGSVLAIALWLVFSLGLPAGTAIRHAAFNTVSIVTTTGYASADYGIWGAFPVTALFFLMCVGGCTGSTTGGIKVFRFTVLYATASAQVFRLIQPHGVVLATYNGRPLPEAVAVAVMAFITLFGFCFAALALALSMLGLDYLTAMSGALTALANVGPGLGPIIGPTGNFAPLPESAKWLLAFAMLLGRLELLTVLILFSPAFWRT
ncbi:MAG TPA: TrkH family potassium uptake protein [Geminicoccaceae bacterium]|nr:TrkH family potassium uptake protein [Geminicoccaceae bacterium]